VLRFIVVLSPSGAATNIIYGLALGYKSVIIPVFSLAVTIYVSYRLAGMYGIATAALGILSTLATGQSSTGYSRVACVEAAFGFHGSYLNFFVFSVFV
jgi:Na+/H+-translocating membrane pyrophosphatase